MRRGEEGAACLTWYEGVVVRPGRRRGLLSDRGEGGGCCQTGEKNGQVGGGCCHTGEKDGQGGTDAAIAGVGRIQLRSCRTHCYKHVQQGSCLLVSRVKSQEP